MSRSMPISLGKWLRLHGWLRRGRIVVIGVLIAVGVGVQWRSSPWDIGERISVTIKSCTPHFDFLLIDTAERPESANARLLGITIPAAQRESAHQWMAKQCAPTGLWISFDPSYRRDAEGYVLGYLYMADGRMLNESLIEMGFAKADSNSHELSHWFSVLESIARRSKQGMWAELKP